MSETITLPTGDYYIRMHDEPRRFVGVDPRLPMFPRPVVALPQGGQPLWHIQNLDDVRYVIRQNNLATILEGNNVVAQPTQIPHQWIVQHMPSEGQFAFVILNNYPGEHEGAVWSLDSSDPYTRVHLAETKWRGIRIPVGLPKNSLFDIIPLVNKVTDAPTPQPQPTAGVLPDGKYLIKKRGANGGFIAVDESPSGEPEDRKVFVLPGGTRAPVWDVNDAGNGIYTIRQGDWITGSGRTTVVARKAPFLPQQWRLQSFPLEGTNTYMVHSGSVSGNPSWAVTNSQPYAPVDLRKIGPFAPENPPQDALFEFIPVPKDDSPAAAAPTATSNIVIELPAGRYLIKRHNVQDGYLAVKDSTEELRPVIVLPGGTKAPVWNVAAPNFGRYEISSGGFDTQPKGDAVVAGGVSIQQGRWFLQRYPMQGKDCYMIVDDTNTNLAWAVTKPEAYAPVELREVGLFIPESPPKDLLFDLIPVPDDVPPTTGVVSRPIPLPRGEYLIKKHGEHGDYIAIKAGTQEFRPVITLPAGTLAPMWNIGFANPGRYEISSGGMETRPVGERIVAGGISIMQGQWFLRHYPQQGEYCYMIISDIDPGMGWAVTQSGADAPVEFKEVGFFAPELPPPDFLFDLVPVKRA